MNADVDSYSPSFLDSLPERGGPNEPNRSRALLPERSPGELRERSMRFGPDVGKLPSEVLGVLFL